MLFIVPLSDENGNENLEFGGLLSRLWQEIWPIERKDPRRSRVLESKGSGEWTAMASFLLICTSLGFSHCAALGLFQWRNRDRRIPTGHLSCSTRSRWWSKFARFDSIQSNTLFNFSSVGLRWWLQYQPVIWRLFKCFWKRRKST